MNLFKRLGSSTTFLSAVVLVCCAIGGWFVWSGFNAPPKHTPDISHSIYASKNQSASGPTSIQINGKLINAYNMDNSHLLIPSIRVYANINESQSTGTLIEHSLVLPSEKEVTQWRGGGQITNHMGTVLVAGHVSWNSNPGALYNLAKVKMGELAYVSNGAGKFQAYQLESLVPVKKKNLPENIWTKTGAKKLVVVTCGGKLKRMEDGSYHFDSNIVSTWKPVGSPQVIKNQGKQ